MNLPFWFSILGYLLLLYIGAFVITFLILIKQEAPDLLEQDEDPTEWEEWQLAFKIALRFEKNSYLRTVFFPLVLLLGLLLNSRK